MLSNQPLGIALEQAIRRLEFGGYAYHAPAWHEQKPKPVIRPTRRVLSDSVWEIVSAIAAAFDISPWAIISPRRPARTCRARFAVYKILRDHHGYSLPKIAKATKRKDHTTIMHGLRRAGELFATDPEWAAAYRAAEHALDQQK